MFRHSGKTRTISHNLRIASLLSFVAGIVNVAGFLAVQKLTTNVTGHFAFVMDEILKLHFTGALVYFLYIIFFLFGSFISSVLVETTGKLNERYIYAVPVIIESIILIGIAVFSSYLLIHSPNTIAFSLLFAMGLQNSLVTQISNAVVRTTHLTGLFTDLGIELSQLFFYKENAQQLKLKSSIKLRSRIIVFFFGGGIAGGLIYLKIGLKVLILCGIILIAGLIYDWAKYKMLLLKRKLSN